MEDRSLTVVSFARGNDLIQLHARIAPRVCGGALSGGMLQTRYARA